MVQAILLACTEGEVEGQRLALTDGFLQRKGGERADLL
jgi:hypothetical protein